MQFEDGRVYVFIGIALVLAAMLLTRHLERSRYGMSLRAIKQDETAAEASGIDTLAWKLRAIALSGGMAAAIGGFYAVVQLVVTPLSVFGMLVSAQALIVAMFGGVGTVWGPLTGAIVLVPLSAWLDARYAADYPGIQGVVYGTAIIAVILAAPEGVFWKVRDALAKRRGITVSDDDTTVIDTDAASGRFAVSDKPAGENLLEVRSLSKTFGGLKAVDDVSFTARRGEILGVIGPNGAGKTTLFNLINGLIPADSGDVTLAGRSIRSLRPNRICAAGLGRTFQVVKSFDRMSIADNVIVGTYVHTRSLSEARATARDALAVVGLTDVAGRLAGSASNRELRLMEIARALASRPELLLLDEVFAGLTAAETAELMELFRKLVELGITLVIIEHTMKAMVRLVDRFIVLDHGSVLTSGEPEAVTQDPAVIEAYLGKKWLENA
ncbi:MAG TPA: branched-chain amino acid ABC transporter ATP-binding protein/permease, partial [Gammaproteobacteria bacterium]